MMNKRKQLGNAMVEYLVVTIIVLVILGATSVGSDGNSAISFFLNSIGTGFDRFSGFMSLP